MRQMRQRLAGRRIDDVLALAAIAVKPGAVDVKLKLEYTVTSRSLSYCRRIAFSRAGGHAADGTAWRS